MTDSPIRHAAGAAFPGRSIREVEPQETRPGNETARVTFEDGRVCYLKTPTDTTERLVREAAAVRYAGAHCDVETPAIVVADPTGDPPYLATAPLPGTALNDPWTGGGDRERLLREAGRAVAGVHEATFDRTGIIEGGDLDGLELSERSWTETLAATVEWRGRDWFAERFADAPGRLAAAIRAFEPTFDGPATLVHGDPSRINLHLDPVGLLDWERALVGDPAFGLVDATFHLLEQPDVGDDERPALRDALYDGYRQHAGELPTGLADNRPLYRAVSYLLVLQAFEDWSADAEPPSDELAADVREEFDSRLAAVRDAAS